METTLFLSKVLGPVLLIRAISILIDRQHFTKMLDNVENEVSTVSFSLFPVALMMAGITLARNARRHLEPGRDHSPHHRLGSDPEIVAVDPLPSNRRGQSSCLWKSRISRNRVDHVPRSTEAT